jgi:transposase
VFDCIFAGLAGEGPKPERVMIDATHLKAHRTAASLLKKGMFPVVSGAQKGGLNSKLHAVCDGEGRPLVMLLSEGQMSDDKGAALMIEALPPANAMLADRGYDADGFRSTLLARGITPCIPSKTNRKTPIPHDGLLYRQRHRIENILARLKDWRRIHTRYNRCAHTFFSTICITAAVAFWLSSMTPEPGRLLKKSAAIRHCERSEAIQSALWQFAATFGTK